MMGAKKLKLKHYLWFWGASFALFILFLWLFKSILLPFVLGIAIAYLLNPLAERMQRAGANRSLSAALIMLAFFTFIGAALALSVPILYREALDFMKSLPDLLDRLIAMSAPYHAQILALSGQAGGAGDGEGASFDGVELFRAHAKEIFGAGLSLFGSVKSGGAALLSFLSIVFLTPIVAFFMIAEWPRVTGWVMDLLPRRHEKIIRKLLGEMDVKISAFVRGQLQVALCLGIIYAILLSLAGLKNGLLIGLAAGFLNIVPLLGTIAGLVISVSLALVQSGDLMFAAVIAGIFIAGQIFESNVMTPKLVGDKVGLHPLWVFFALLGGSALLGISGMLIAIPVAAVLSVLFGFMIEQYKASAYFEAEDDSAAVPSKDAEPKPKPKKKRAKDAKSS
ncbi:MAG: AI-2E family transporter [Alphaproteobacteria bacterium]